MLEYHTVVTRPAKPDEWAGIVWVPRWEVRVRVEERQQIDGQEVRYVTNERKFSRIRLSDAMLAAAAWIQSHEALENWLREHTLD